MDQLNFLGRLIIAKEPPERILNLIRMCHPGEHGEPYSRWDVIGEIRRRGLSQLIDYGWRIDDVFKNFYTGHEMTLIEMWIGKNYCWGPDHYRNWSHPCFRAWLGDNLFVIMEHWCPKGLWEPSQLHDEYRDLFGVGVSAYAG